jgi:hypothetical protein
VQGDVGGGGVDPAHPGDPLTEPLDMRGEQPVRGRSDGNGEEGSQGRAPATMTARRATECGRERDIRLSVPTRGDTQAAPESAAGSA